MPSQMFTERHARPWKRTISGLSALLDEVTDTLDDDDLPEGLAERVHTLLEANGVPEEVRYDFRYADHVYEINDALEGLYDWADLNRVWIEPTNRPAGEQS